MEARRALLETLQAEFGRSPWGQSPHREAFSRLLAAGPQAFERDHYEPGHLTASAFVLSPSGDELLLIQHRKLRLWLQPGGHIEPGDADLLGAALRELREETGVEEVEVLEPYFDVDVHTIPAFPGAPAHLHHDVRILARARERRAEALDGALDVAWFPLQELAEGDGPLARGFDTDESVRAAARHLWQLGRERKRASV